MEKLESLHMGEVWPAAQPAGDAVLYGHVRLSPGGSVEARSLQTFTLTYTAGRFGIDGGGGIKLVFRFTADWGRLQTEDPAAVNYVTAENSRGLPLRLRFSDVGHPRPWFQSLDVLMPWGYLAEGDTITIRLGDRSGGSPGLKVQSCCESDFRFMVLVDVCATGHYLPVAESPSIAITSGPAAIWRAVLPSLRRPGERFRLGVRAEDRWGNPTDKAEAQLQFKTTLPVSGLPETARHGPGGAAASSFDELSVGEEGILVVDVLDEAGALLARSSPLVVRDASYAGYWADLHGQSGESVGINTARQYFNFARDTAFLDGSSHQANDFQVNNAFWDHLNRLTASYNQDGRFVTFPGYEWSGNTPLGGDRNVYFRHEGRQIRRSSHALLPDRSDIETDANDARALFAALKTEDAVVFAHVGGRWADLTFAHDGSLETAVEIHSAWGTFEWLMADAFKLRHRMGVVCNSDGHKGRPGASHPGASEFAAYGGLTCLLAEALTRDAIFACLRRRRHYGTTGSRLHLDVRARAAQPLRRYDRDPAVFADADTFSADEASMGDIVEIPGELVCLEIEVVAGAPVERVEVRNGTDVVTVVRPYAPEDLGDRVRIVMSGAERRGKGSRTRWQGTAQLSGARIREFRAFNAWNHELPFGQKDATTVAFEARTAGNLVGFDLWLDPAPEARLRVATAHGTLDAALADVGYEDTKLDLGGLDRCIRAFRLPENNPHHSLRRVVAVPLRRKADNPLWVCVTTEDGHQAWSSPIYFIPEG